MCFKTAAGVNLAITVVVIGVGQTVVVLVATTIDTLVTLVGDRVARSVVVMDVAGMSSSCHGNNKEEDDGSLHGGCGCDGRSTCEVG